MELNRYPFTCGLVDVPTLANKFAQKTHLQETRVNRVNKQE